MHVNRYVLHSYVSSVLRCIRSQILQCSQSMYMKSNIDVYKVHLHPALLLGICITM